MMVNKTHPINHPQGHFIWLMLFLKRLGIKEADMNNFVNTWSPDLKREVLVSKHNG